MKVAVLGSTYPRSHDDPGVPWQRQTVNRCARSTHDLIVLAPSWRGLTSHTIDGVQVLRWRYAPKSIETLTHDEGAPNKQDNTLFMLLSFSYIFCGIIAVFWWCIKYKIDVIHCHWPFPHGLMTILPQKLLGVKVVMTCHGAELALSRKKPVIRHILSSLLDAGDALCANSSHTASEMKKLGAQEINILPYGATVVSAHTEDTPPEENKPPLLLNCGRLIQRKGLHILLQALPEVLKHHRVRVVITGEGSCKEEWMQMSRNLGLDGVVEWAGFVSEERLASLYQECTCYVHPAIHDDNGDTEGLGVVLIEALRHRKPVVASEVGGIVDVIRHQETGLLVPEKDPSALATSIIKILDDPQLATTLADQGFTHCQEFFDWDHIVARTLDVYQSA